MQSLVRWIRINFHWIIWTSNPLLDHFISINFLFFRFPNAYHFCKSSWNEIQKSLYSLCSLDFVVISLLLFFFHFAEVCASDRVSAWFRDRREKKNTIIKTKTTATKKKKQQRKLKWFDKRSIIFFSPSCVFKAIFIIAAE